MMSSTQAVTITLGADDVGPSVALPLSVESPWTNLLGAWPLPATGALDTLAGAMDWLRDPPELVTLRGCPSASLLPILWLRTTWLASGARVIIDWPSVEDPADQPGRQAAGRLACLLASSVRCADEGRARVLWGYEPSTRDRGATPFPARVEAFDLLNNLIDLWGLGPRYASRATSWAHAARRELLKCASQGLRRVALYGAGTHTRALGEVLMEPDVEIAAIIDDDARRHGSRLWGYPIISPEEALGMNLDAIILSANSVEDLLWERTARHREAGIRVVRLYGGQPIAPALRLAPRAAPAGA